MPISLIAATALVMGMAVASPWIVAFAIAAITAIGTLRAAAKAHGHGHRSGIAEARAPGAILFSLFAYGLLIGLPYLVGVGIRSAIG
jgi:hypothetical protein